MCISFCVFFSSYFCTACKLLNFLINLLMFAKSIHKNTQFPNSFRLLFWLLLESFKKNKTEFEIYFGFYHQHNWKLFSLVDFCVVYFYYFCSFWRLTKCKIYKINNIGRNTGYKLFWKYLFCVFVGTLET